jgi:uncharacterized protein
LASIPGKLPSYTEVVLVIAICFGQFIVWSVFGSEVDISMPEAYWNKVFAGSVLVELMFAAMGLAFLHICGHQLSELLPAPNLRGCLEGVVLCAVLVGARIAVETLIPFEPEALARIAQIKSIKPSLSVSVAAYILNALYHETFLLGYLVRSFAPKGVSFALGLSVLIRVLYQSQQGPVGAVSAVATGLILGLAYWRTRRVWPAVVGHAMADIITYA